MSFYRSQKHLYDWQTIMYQNNINIIVLSMCDRMQIGLVVCIIVATYPADPVSTLCTAPKLIHVHTMRPTIHPGIMCKHDATGK